MATGTDQLRLVGEVCERPAPEGGADPLVLIGSSMGGYLAALYASRASQASQAFGRPVAALVLMAPAVDFHRRWAERHVLTLNPNGYLLRVK